MAQLETAQGANSVQVDALDSSPGKGCGKCGRKHRRNQCPAFGSMCDQCGKPNCYGIKYDIVYCPCLRLNKTLQ